MSLDGAELFHTHGIPRRSFVALLTGGVLGAVVPGRIDAGDLQTSNRTGPTLNDYEFIPPERWTVQRRTDRFSLLNPESGCALELYEPRAQLGSLQEVAEVTFSTQYAGWRFRQTGEQQYLLSTGVLPKGLEYFMLEAEVTKDGGEFGGILEGAALIVKAGSQIVILTALHKPLMTGHRPCWATYATWRRFFNSFTVRNTPIVKIEPGELSRRIVGRWATAQGRVASGELVFAPNGTYTSDVAIGGPQSGAIAGTSRASGYSLTGDQLSMRPPRGTEEVVRVRFDRVNHGGTGWKDRLWMLKKDMYGENEVSYERIG